MDGTVGPVVLVLCVSVLTVFRDILNKAIALPSHSVHPVVSSFLCFLCWLKWSLVFVIIFSVMYNFLEIRAV